MTKAHATTTFTMYGHTFTFKQVGKVDAIIDTADTEPIQGHAAIIHLQFHGFRAPQNNEAPEPYLLASVSVSGIVIGGQSWPGAIADACTAILKNYGLTHH